MAEDLVRVEARVDRRGVALDLTLPAGTTTALVGPNGSGKSTAVALISGTLRPDAGSVRIGGTTLAAPQAFVPPHHRSVGLLEQRPLLFPHLSVLDNVAFGVRARGSGRALARDRALAELAAVGAEQFAGRRPHTLSGGEAQRVALARALATDPDVLLFDEPFAALDVTTAAALRRTVAARLARRPVTTLLVTHDPLDVWALADRLVALEDGRVAASGGVEELLSRPRTGFLARLSGVNLLSGVAEADGVRAGRELVAGLWEPPPADPSSGDRSGAQQDHGLGGGRPPAPGRRALATFPPAAVALYPDAPPGSPRNTWPVAVTGLEPRGDTVRIRLELDDGQPLEADLTPRATAALGIVPRRRLVAQVKATQVRLYPRP